ncbi:MAG TPA: glycosyltransferase, partial [Chitinophagaceae bacterium]|nr:glycosyltransferase [Chitinophagaceae bacterium]
MSIQNTLTNSSCAYSVILPILNEESCLRDVLKEIELNLQALGKIFEIICIDDGSTDSTWAIIEHLNKEKPFIKGIRFSRNFGHQIAVYAGIKHSCGDY